ncbi:MAG TPA: hypothetical protein VMD91_01225 [Candidatus Sulfotelmatobacter sp.]|nr:hypothetical protein [Candidatus Sulfotelmatobacter sp.]
MDLDKLIYEWRQVDMRRHAAQTPQEANALFGVLELLHMRVFSQGERGIVAFTRLLGDPDDRVRVDAAAALLPYRNKEAEAILREAANRSLTARYVLAEWGKGMPKPAPVVELPIVEDRIAEVPVLFRIRLSEAERSRAHLTPRTVHRSGAVPLPVAHTLAIACADGEATYYLLYLDEAGAVQSECSYSSVEAAMRQAEFEFGLPPEEWMPSAKGAKLQAAGE